MLMDFYPHCTETEVWADDDHGAHPINTLAFFAFPPGQVRAHGCPIEQEHDREDTLAERRSLRDPRDVVHNGTQNSSGWNID